MSPRKVIISTSLLSAVLVLGIAAPAAYFGFHMLDKKIETGQAEVKSVVIELKAEALEEIKTVAEQTASEAMSKGGPNAPDVSAALSSLNSGLTDLQTRVSDLQTEQKNLAELMKLRTDGLMAAATAPKMARPGAREDTLNQTIYFSLGVFAGPKTDKQIAAVIPKIVEYSTSGNCKSNVMGFSDTLGGDKSNLELSLKRAQHVATLLRGKNIPVGTVKGWGERWLDVHTVDGIKNDKNRRVVIETVCGAAQVKATQSVS